MYAPAKRRLIPRSRSMVFDGLSLSPRHVYYPVERIMHLGDVAAARSASATRVSWSVVWMKAYSAVCARTPRLRQSYIRWPWPHLMEIEEVVSMLIVNRMDQGDERLFWARFCAPQNTSLVDLQTELDRHQNDPIERAFRKQFQFSMLPFPLRRFLWWWQMHFSGKKRARRLGSFSQSTLAGQGANNGFHQTILTSSLCFGPLDDQGRCTGTIIGDHRVIDGMDSARALEELEKELRGAILAELRTLAVKKLAA